MIYMSQFCNVFCGPLGERGVRNTKKDNAKPRIEIKTLMTVEASQIRA